MRRPILATVLASLGCLGLAVACGGGETPTAKTPILTPPPATNTTAVATSSSGPAMPALPPPADPKPVTPAKVFEVASKNGIKTLGIASKSLPIVYLDVVVRAGNAVSSVMGTGAASKAGIADLTAELMRQGGAGRFSGPELADRIDALGADLSANTSADSVNFRIAVTTDKLDAALEVISSVLLKPRFDGKEFDKLKARELDRVKQAQKSNGGWLARSALYRDLFGAGHPYAEVDATEQTLTSITLADVKAFYKKAYVAGATTIVVSGDIDQSAIAQKLDDAFKSVNKAAAPVIVYPAVAKTTGTKVILALKPGSKQADVFIGMLGLPRKDPHWAELSIAMGALGGGMSARLFADVREKRSLAYGTGANARELANGPALLALYAGTQTPLAPKSVVALLENLDWITGSKPVTAEELAITKTSLETGFVYRLETIGQVASMAIEREVLGLGGKDVYDFVDSYRKTLHEATLAGVNAVSTQNLKGAGLVIAVAGDMSLAKPLSHFGAVQVVDPTKGFATVSEVPMDANASLEVAPPAPPPAK